MLKKARSALQKLPMVAKWRTKQATARLDTTGPIECALDGKALLNTSIFNKGTAFTNKERSAFGIDGLLPSEVQTLETRAEAALIELMMLTSWIEVRRAYAQYKALPSNILKSTFMTSMHDQNQVLYFRLFQENLKGVTLLRFCASKSTEIMPIVYTPTTGEAIANYSSLFRRPEGCFLSINKPHDIRRRLREWGSANEIDYIVVTDSEAILGIGDQGVGGIGISIAKLSLLTLCGGLHPAHGIPVVLDVGTNNQKLINDPLYLGIKAPRATGEAYDSFLAEFVEAVKELHPNALLHFEDFGLHNARRILDKYQTELACFNDDIQGTGAVVLAALTSAVWVTKQRVRDQKIVVFGAGTAGMGIVEQIRSALLKSGATDEEQRAQIYLVDRNGLILDNQETTTLQKPYEKRADEWAHVGDKVYLLDVIKNVKPNVLIGCSGQSKAFTEEIVKEMAKHVDRPIIFPISNPTSLCEAFPEDVNTWTEGRALIATGSPFPSTEYNGKRYDIAEANNALVYPGIGFGAVISRSVSVSDEMIIEGSKALAALSPALKDPDKSLLPDMRDVQATSTTVAAAVVKQAIREGKARVDPKVGSDEELLDWVRRHQWKPEYRPLKKVSRLGASRKQKGQLGIGKRSS